MPIALTNDNYFSKQADIDYMSVSQFKDFAGTLYKKSCENTAYLKFTGVLPSPETTALLVGSYIDSHYEGELDKFIAEHPQILSSSGATKGQPKAEFKQADSIIKRLERDKLFSEYMSGEKQKIYTFQLFGVWWKIKIDSLLPDKIVDLKIMKDMKPIWSDDLHQKIDFIHYWGYDIQGAVYQKGVELVTGKRLPFYIACGTKETVTDFNIIQVTQPHLDKALAFVQERLPRVLAVKTGQSSPERCGICANCMNTKVLTAPITIDDIMPEVKYSNIPTEEDEGY